MRKINYGVIGVLLLLGLLVFGFSLYVASLSGLMNRLGLMGGDLRESIDANELYRGVMEGGGIPECEWWVTTKMIPRYLFTPKEQRVELGLQLGKQRRNCAITYLLAGNTERGVYTLLKGMRYERVNLIELLRQMERGRRSCDPRLTTADLGMVEAFIEASRGNPRDVIYKEYEEIGQIRSRLEERCEN